MLEKLSTAHHGDEISGIRQHSEIALHVPNELKVLAKLFRTLAAEHNSVLAWCFYRDHERATALVVSSDERKASRALLEAGFNCEISRVVVLGQKDLGMSTAQIKAELRPAGINIMDAYACCSVNNGALLALEDGRHGAHRGSAPSHPFIAARRARLRTDRSRADGAGELSRGYPLAS